MNTIAHLAALLAITDFAIDMFVDYSEQTLGVALLGLWLLYAVLVFKAMLEDWQYYMGERPASQAINGSSVWAVGTVLTIVSIKILHTVWV